MLDVLFPAGRELDDGLSLDVALERTGVIATDRARATADRASIRGRASYLGDRAIGSADPGATSAALVVTALRAAVPAT
jgi:dihydroxyacetone kinase